MESMTLCVSHSPGFARDHAEEHGHEFRAGIRRAAELVADFGPTLCVFFGSDHRRAYQETIPAISVALAAEGMGDLLSPTGSYDVPAALAQSLATGLLAAGIDVAVSHAVRLDHGFGLTAADVLGGIDRIPTIPVYLNCATPPLAPPSRAATLGHAVRRLLAGLDERILFIGSGGLSHSPPTLEVVDRTLSEEERRAISLARREAAKDKIRPDWDQAFLADLASADDTWAASVTQDRIDPAGVGANEVRTWLAAYCAGGKPLRRLVYEPVREWLTGVAVAVSEYDARSAAA